MKQFLSHKEQYPDALLFFRMGDFYELFFEDAVTAAKALDLKLTSRNSGEPDGIPMAGVPHHAAQIYIARLLEQGFNVAVCEQLEDPSKTKGMVKRGVVRVFTPAIVLDGEALAPRSHQFLAAVTPPEAGPDAPGRWGFASFDVTTGELFVGEVSDLTAVAGEVRRLDVRELLVPREAEAQIRSVTKLVPRLYLRVVSAIPHKEAVDLLAQALGEHAVKESAEGVSVQGRIAAGLTLAYAKTTQPNHAVVVRRLVGLDPRDHLVLDETAQTHLELFTTMRGERKGSLLQTIDSTVTPMGARRLRTWLAFPLLDPKRIRKRHDAVGALVTAVEQRKQLRDQLEPVPDLERIATRATLGAITPKDMGNLRDGLARVPAISALLQAVGGPLKSIKLGDDTAPLHALLAKALVPSPPAAVADGGLFKQGFEPKLDELLKLATGGREQMQAMEQRERERTKIGSLKVSYNRVFGYFIEVTKANLKSVPAEYKRKQTVAGGERFVTEELQELEQKILTAEEQLKSMEAELFERLAKEVAKLASSLARLAGVLADLDVLSSFAEIAHRFDYVRPDVDEGTVIELQEARHPVVESVLEPGAFVPNDVLLDLRSERFLLVTGPNMAGKSTLMRQVALAVLLAQAGAFVPAKHARIGVVDRVFTRVGASDDLARGESTFMVEMRETAQILRGATSRSLVIFDEIGRGTSTYDGLAIAWAVAEYLHDIVRCRGLFATHYHELCALADSRPHAANVNVSARETGDDIVFLHKLGKGGASRSYGIAVAKLAGLPEQVVARARALLKDLERGEGPGAPAKQLGLFEKKPEALEHPVLSTLLAADIDNMTPRGALDFVFQLKALLDAAKPKAS